jgi:hypothetical protein
MKQDIAAKKSHKKHLLGFLLLLAPILLIGCGGGPKHMIQQEQRPQIKAKSDKAVLVIARTTSVGFAVTIENYLDGKLIGQTKGKCYFITEVAPGQHYVTAHAENWAVARINFEAGKIYFFNQGIFMGIWMARTGFSVMSAEETLKQIAESGTDYYVYNNQKPGEDMSADDFKGVKEDFEKEVKEDPGRHKDTLEYKGVSKI